jgi:hypothetical protein
MENMLNDVGKLVSKGGTDAQEVARALLNYKVPGAGATQKALNTTGIVNALGRPSIPGVPIPGPAYLGGTKTQ